MGVIPTVAILPRAAVNRPVKQQVGDLVDRRTGQSRAPPKPLTTKRNVM